MQKVDSPRSKGWNVVLFLITLLVVTADQLSKLWIRSNLALGEAVFEVGFFRFTHVQNTGAAFGLFQGQSFALTIVNLVGLAAFLFFILFYYRRFPYLHNTLGKIALGLVPGGIVGNLIDRLRFGYVTDFINFGFWPAFNIADAAGVVGIIILTYSLIRLTWIKESSDGQDI